MSIKTQAVEREAVSTPKKICHVMFTYLNEPFCFDYEGCLFPSLIVCILKPILFPLNYTSTNPLVTQITEPVQRKSPRFKEAQTDNGLLLVIPPQLREFLLRQVVLTMLLQENNHSKQCSCKFKQRQTG